jgi:hypothetical protein
MRAHYFSRLLLLVVAMLALAGAASAQVAVGVSVSFGPPELPVYDQPLCPGDGYIWTPGYWAWDGNDYYWVPGTWVEAPEVGFLWTPGWWGWENNAFFFHEGFWGPTVGFYGGINYGFGYFGHGYEGGRWDNGHFFYNRSVNNVNVTVIHNVYNTTIVNRSVTRVSYNGGNGGVNVRATSEEEAAMRGRHIPPVAAQTQHMEAARGNPQLRASANHGKPPIAATARPAEFSGGGSVAAREGGKYTPPPNRTETNRPAETNTAHPPVHPNEIPPTAKNAPYNTGNPNLDKKYQQQQDKLNAKQNQDRAKLQQKQEQDHQKMAKQADDARKQQVEQQHQQQTQQQMQKHAQQQQQLQQHQQPPHQAAPPPHEAEPKH